MKSNIEKWHIVAYLDSFPLPRVLRDRQARLTSLQGRMSEAGRQVEGLVEGPLSESFGENI
jgi:hypothetical protein